MAELTVQSERAFLKQPHIFQNPKTAAKSKSRRWYKDVGLGFKTPTEAIEGTYIGRPLPKISTACLIELDKKCPFTGQISIRGRILSGVVVSAKMHRTVIIRYNSWLGTGLTGVLVVIISIL
jgi:small subunit ribosomal protein S11e